MSEEVKNSSRNVPTAMVISTMVNGLMAFTMILAVLFCQVDIDSTLDSQYPFVPIFAAGLGSNVGATVLACLPLLLILASAIGAMTAASRMIWAFSRDKGVPGYRSLMKVGVDFERGNKLIDSGRPAY
jgi:amino acid transporter